MFTFLILIEFVDHCACLLCAFIIQFNICADLFAATLRHNDEIQGRLAHLPGRTHWHRNAHVPGMRRRPQLGSSAQPPPDRAHLWHGDPGHHSDIRLRVGRPPESRRHRVRARLQEGHRSNGRSVHCGPIVRRLHGLRPAEGVDAAQHLCSGRRVVWPLYVGCASGGVAGAGGYD